MFKLEFEDWKDARWVINCAMAAIDEHYEKGSVRHNEMLELEKKLHEQMETQVGKETYNT